MKAYLLLLCSVCVLSACSLDRSGLAGMPGGELSASPALACPGDTVVIRWDTQRPHHPSFCRFPNGNTPALQSCSSSRDCPIGGSACLDNYCNLCSAISNAAERRSECAAPSNQGCQPDLSARIAVTPAPTPPLAGGEDIAEHRGELTFVVQENSDIAFRSEVADPEGNRAGHPEWLGRIDLNARVEVVDPELLRTAANAYECRGSASWPSSRLEMMFPDASPRLRVLRVRNPNRFTVVGSIDGNPLRLEPGATQALGLLPQGLLQAQPAPEYLSTLPPVQCSPAFISGSYPNAPLELTLGCVAPE